MAGFKNLFQRESKIIQSCIFFNKKNAELYIYALLIKLTMHFITHPALKNSACKNAD